MPLLQKNLTPFYWGPKLTSRRPPQRECAICVRGVFRLQPGAPLEAIEDPIDQGFMSGDTFAPDDWERTGPLVHSSDFADWKACADLLLKGTCYPPSPSVACDVRFAVGAWSKTLRVLGPRVFTPGMLFGGSTGEPEPFVKMPLTWENTLGGEGHAANPAGKDQAGGELPTVLHPKPEGSSADPSPASFLPISPYWPQRAGKSGKAYGKAWEETHAPFFAEDFDWTVFNAAPPDQQLDDYLVGDEELVFENMHPTTPVWKTHLPGQRLRVLVKTDEGVLHDVVMRLDTLTADLDAGRLYLNWRGHVPVRELDFNDLGVILLASEPLADDPLPLSHYQPMIAALEDDPTGLKASLPPGFMQVANAIEAVESAELHGTPMPNLRKIAATLPAGCPFPPWFLAAVGGSPDPLGMGANFDPQLFSDDPIGLKAKLGELANADPKQMAASLEAIKNNPLQAPEALEALAAQLPEQQASGIRAAAQTLRENLAKVPEDRPEVLVKLQAPVEPPPPRPTAAEALEGIKATEFPEMPEEVETPQALLDARAKLAAVPTLDAMVAPALAPLDAFVLPEVPEIPDTESELAALAEKLTQDEAKLRARGVDHPLLGLFAMGQRMIEKAPRPSDITPPDMSGLMDALESTQSALLGAGVSLAALAPLTRLTQRLQGVMDALPAGPTKPEAKDFAYRDLRGYDLRGQDLAGKSFARADLRGASLTRANLSGCDFTEANLEQADLTRANLAGAQLGKAKGPRADFTGANLVGANLRAAEFSQADFSDANLEGVDADGANLNEAQFLRARLANANFTDATVTKANFQQAAMKGIKLVQVQGTGALLPGANLEGADLEFAQLDKADFRKANLTNSKLNLANLTKMKGDGVRLAGATFDMTQLTKSRLQGAVLTGAKSSMGSLAGSNLTGADLRDVAFVKADFTGAVLDAANFEGATLRGAILRDTTAHEARFVKADFAGSHVTGKAKFTRCNFVALKGNRSVFMEAELTGCDFSYAELEDCLFMRSHGEDVNFFAASLKKSSFRKAQFTRTRFFNANLCGAQLMESRFVDTQFQAANCYDAKFVESAFATCDWSDANLSRARFDRAVGAPER